MPVLALNAMALESRVTFREDFMRRLRTTEHENRVQRPAFEETGDSVLQGSVVGGCLKVGSPCEDIDPAEKTDPRR